MEGFETQQYGNLTVEVHDQHRIAVLDLASVRALPGNPADKARAVGEAGRQLGRSGCRRLLAGHVDSQDRPLVQCLERAGFTVRLKMLSFECDPGRAVAAGKPPMPPPDGVEFSDCSGLSAEEVRTCVLECFPEDDPDEIADKTVSAADFLPCVSGVAREGGSVIGFVFVTAAGPEAAYLAYQGTIPDWQRKGIGTRLLWHCVEAAMECGFARLSADQIYADNAAVVCLLEKCRFEQTAPLLNMSLALQQPE